MTEIILSLYKKCFKIIVVLVKDGRVTADHLDLL